MKQTEMKGKTMKRIILIDENGVQYFGYSSPKETVKLVNESVELLPFDEVQRIAKTRCRCASPMR